MTASSCSRRFLTLPGAFPTCASIPISSLQSRSILKTAAPSQGFIEHGEPIGFEDMPKLDFCVVGCVAVTRLGGRTGKGAGFAGLEQGVFRGLGVGHSPTPL